MQPTEPARCNIEATSGCSRREFIRQDFRRLRDERPGAAPAETRPSPVDTSSVQTGTASFARVRSRKRVCINYSCSSEQCIGSSQSKEAAFPSRLALKSFQPLKRPGDDARFDGGGNGNLAAANDDSSAVPAIADSSAVTMSKACVLSSSDGN